MTSDGGEMSVAERVAAAMANHEWSRQWLNPVGPVDEAMIAAAEQRCGHAFPESLREFYLRTIDADGNEFNLLHQINPEGWSWVQSNDFTILPHPDGGKVGWYEIYVEGWQQAPPVTFRDWFVNDAYHVGKASNDQVLLDFGFDPVDPPVVFLAHERDHTGIELLFVASTFLNLLEHERIHEDPNDPYHVDNVVHKTSDQIAPLDRRVDWYDYRDAHILPSQAGRKRRFDVRPGDC